MWEIPRQEVSAMMGVFSSMSLQGFRGLFFLSMSHYSPGALCEADGLRPSKHVSKFPLERLLWEMLDSPHFLASILL